MKGARELAGGSCLKSGIFQLVRTMHVLGTGSM